jgi:hypothetical protein
MTVEQLAREMYETQENRVIPGWDSLSGGTRSLWLERAQALMDLA